MGNASELCCTLQFRLERWYMIDCLLVVQALGSGLSAAFFQVGTIRQSLCDTNDATTIAARSQFAPTPGGFGRKLLTQYNATFTLQFGCI